MESEGQTVAINIRDERNIQSEVNKLVSILESLWKKVWTQSSTKNCCSMKCPARLSSMLLTRFRIGNIFIWRWSTSAAATSATTFATTRILPKSKPVHFISFRIHRRLHCWKPRIRASQGSHPPRSQTLKPGLWIKRVPPLNGFRSG